MTDQGRPDEHPADDAAREARGDDDRAGGGQLVGGSEGGVPSAPGSEHATARPRPDPPARPTTDPGAGTPGSGPPQAAAEDFGGRWFEDDDSPQAEPSAEGPGAWPPPSPDHPVAAPRPVPGSGGGSPVADEPTIIGPSAAGPGARPSGREAPAAGPAAAEADDWFAVEGEPEAGTPAAATWQQEDDEVTTRLTSPAGGPAVDDEPTVERPKPVLRREADDGPTRRLRPPAVVPGPSDTPGTAGPENADQPVTEAFPAGDDPARRPPGGDGRPGRVATGGIGGDAGDTPGGHAAEKYRPVDDPAGRDQAPGDRAGEDSSGRRRAGGGWPADDRTERGEVVRGVAGSTVAGDASDGPAGSAGAGDASDGAAGSAGAGDASDSPAGSGGGVGGLARSGRAGETPAGNDGTGDAGETPAGSAAGERGSGGRGAAAPEGTAAVSPDEVTAEGEGGAAPGVPVKGWSFRRFVSAGVLIWVLLALFGFTLVVQLRSNNSDEGLASARQDDLVRILSDLEAQDTRLQAEIAALETSQRQLTSGVAGRQAALAEAEKRADELGLLAGTLPGRGPGLEITVDGVRASAVLNAVQELRGAGGEVMQLTGADGAAVRIVASTYFVDAQGGGIVADGKRLTGPYRLLVIGVPQTMQTALEIPGGVVASVKSGGGSVTMEQRDSVDVTALREATSLQYARPVS